MKRLIAFLAFAGLVACTDEGPMEPGSPNVDMPAFVVTTQSAGGVAMASGSGCTHVDTPESYLCSFKVTGLPAGPANVINYGYWTVKFQCVAPRSGKPGARSKPAYGIVHGINISHNQVNSVNGEVSARGVQVLPPSEADASPYLCQVAPYTQAQFLEKFKPYGWRILAMWALDINNYYVSLQETY